MNIQRVIGVACISPVTRMHLAFLSAIVDVCLKGTCYLPSIASIVVYLVNPFASKFINQAEHMNSASKHISLN